MSIWEQTHPYTDAKNHLGTFGIEIETETPGEDSYPFEFNWVGGEYHSTSEIPGLPMWVAHTDNSLRNFGVEFVLGRPLSFEETCQQLDAWEDRFSSTPFVLDAPATSVHVHVNFQNESWLTLANFFTTYVALENVLMEIAGRRSNLFALPIRVVEEIPTKMAKVIEGWAQRLQFSSIVSSNKDKYGAINISNITQNNSLEFRAHRGTTNVTEIKLWVSILNDILIYARTPGLTPPNIYNVLRHDPVELAEALIPGELLIGKPVYELMLRNAWYARGFAFAMDYEEVDGAKDRILGTRSQATSKKYNPYLEAMVMPSNAPVFGSNSGLVITDDYAPAPTPVSWSDALDIELEDEDED